jgi:hypothetical protein
MSRARVVWMTLSGVYTRRATDAPRSGSYEVCVYSGLHLGVRIFSLVISPEEITEAEIVGSVY